MAALVGPRGSVVGIDHIPELVQWSIENVRRDGKSELLTSGRLQLLVADGFDGHAKGAPYDFIHVGAAPATIPTALKQQLKPGGVLLLPVGPAEKQVFTRVTRSPDGASFVEEPLFAVRYVPLTTAEQQLRNAR